MKTIASVATIAVLVAAASVYSLTGRARPEDRPAEVRPVKVQRVMANATAEVSVYSGEIKPRTETPMAFRVPGRIAQRHVDVGTAVRKGALLATLDATDYQLGVQGLRAQLASAEADARFQASDIARAGELLKKGFISPADFERRRNVDEQARAKVEQARAALAQTQNQSDYTSLRALSDGVVTGVDAESGQVVTAGQTVMRIARLDEKEAIIHVPENRLGELRSPDAIRVSLWAHPEKSYRGRLREISPAADPVTRTYVGKVTIVDADAAVQIGMTANVSIGRSAEGRGQHLLPLTALVERDDGTSVWVLDDATSTVRLVRVRIGSYSGNRISVVEGLSDGDLVVTAGVHKLHPQQKVSMLDEAAK